MSSAAAADEKDCILLDGESLLPETLVHIGYGQCTIGLTPAAWTKVQHARDVIDKIVAGDEVVYGINTGFGSFAHVIIPDDKLAELQVNLIRSHAAGVGEPLTREQTRMLLALRINVLAKGHSGIRVESVKTMVRALNANCLPVVPQQGTVGASGDLAPLSHLAVRAAAAAANATRRPRLAAAFVVTT
jgi:histidine ammonia-lyase